MKVHMQVTKTCFIQREAVLDGFLLWLWIDIPRVRQTMFWCSLYFTVIGTDWRVDDSMSDKEAGARDVSQVTDLPNCCYLWDSEKRRCHMWHVWLCSEVMSDAFWSPLESHLARFPGLKAMKDHGEESVWVQYLLNRMRNCLLLTQKGSSFIWLWYQ